MFGNMLQAVGAGRDVRLRHEFQGVHRRPVHRVQRLGLSGRPPLGVGAPRTRRTATGRTCCGWRRSRSRTGLPGWPTSPCPRLARRGTHRRGDGPTPRRRAAHPQGRLSQAPVGTVVADDVAAPRGEVVRITGGPGGLYLRPAGLAGLHRSRGRRGPAGPPGPAGLADHVPGGRPPGRAGLVAAGSRPVGARRLARCRAAGARPRIARLSGAPLPPSGRRRRRPDPRPRASRCEPVALVLPHVYLRITALLLRRSIRRARSAISNGCNGGRPTIERYLLFNASG